jgi:PncC family amidohydrolase
MDRLTSMGSELGALLKAREQTIAVAESSTGGIVSAALLAVPGASAYFLGGGVIYTRAARRALLEFSELDAKMQGSTEDYALLVARTIRDKLGADWGLAESGASGPTGNRYGDAAGHACIAITGPVERVITVETGSGAREANMWRFAEAALELLGAALETSAKKA